MWMMRQFVLCYTLFFMGFLLAGCESSSPAVTESATLTMTMPRAASATSALTLTPHPPIPRRTPTFLPTFNSTADALTNPPAVSTGTPVVDADGNVTWHPEEELVSWEQWGNDGNDYYYNYFTLFWDGTLVLHNNRDLPYALRLSQTEICKILNTVEASGFFEEKDGYVVPFDGLGSSMISVNAWKTNRSDAQILDAALSGAPYSRSMFCRNCPTIPSEKTIIQPGFANTRIFLGRYDPKNADEVLIQEILVRINETQRDPNSKWYLESISFDEFMRVMTDCDENNLYCGYYDGKIFRGEIAQEIMQKIGDAAVFNSSLFPLSISYSPKAPEIPPDTTLTCSVKDGQYPVLPLSHENEFWYYTRDGKWGAERVKGQNKMKVVNTSGYEKFYGYDPVFFGQTSIQVYPRYWSVDGEFFYVNILPGDFEPNVSFVNSIGLQQIDVKNEKIKYLFLGGQGQTFAYQFSTDGKKVAYIRQGDRPLKLVVVNASSGEEQSVSLTTAEGTSYSSAGTLIWSYDDDKIFLAVGYEENGIQKGRILVADAGNLADVRLVYQSDEPIKLRQGFSVDICPIQMDGENYCPIRLNMETEEVQ